MERKDRETIRFFDLPDLGHVQAVRGLNVANEFPRHAHGGFCIGLVERGARDLCDGKSSVIVRENGLFVINPGRSHACGPRDGRHSYFTICVETEYMRQTASRISGKERPAPYFRQILLDDGLLGARVRCFLSLVENGGSSAEKKSVLDGVLSSLILRYAEEPPAPSRPVAREEAIASACEFIRTNHARELSLKGMAAVVHLSPFYFQRLFLRTVGVTPHDYLMQCRVRQARELLSKGGSIAEIALDTGFVDQSHFTRSFKRAMGITPGVYLGNGGQ